MKCHRYVTLLEMSTYRNTSDFITNESRRQQPKLFGYICRRMEAKAQTPLVSICCGLLCVCSTTNEQHTHSNLSTTNRTSKF